MGEKCHVISRLGQVLRTRKRWKECVTCHKIDRSLVVLMAKEHVKYSMNVCVFNDTR
jgi:hypothetical protein